MNLPATLTAPRPMNRRYTLLELGPESARRPEVERFIAHAFATAHDARLQAFLPNLVALQNAQGSFCSAVGYRHADVEPLFLEHYLPGPVEDVVAARSGGEVRRDQITEIGNLAGMSCRHASHLVSRIPALLLAKRRSWVVFTATRLVRDILDGIGAETLELAEARRSSLGEAAANWGRYFDHDPRIMAAWLPRATDLRHSRRAHQRRRLPQGR